jgi:hypothetical protein
MKYEDDDLDHQQGLPPTRIEKKLMAPACTMAPAGLRTVLRSVRWLSTRSCTQNDVA